MTEYPFAAIVGMDTAKLALMLVAVDPKLGGVLIADSRGKAKSLLARSFVQNRPFVEVPVGATEDRLLGSVNIEATLRRGRRELVPGLIAQAHNGFLYVDEANLLEPQFAWHIAIALSSGILRVERDGLSRTSHAEFSVIATYDPLEGAIDPRLSDAIGLHVRGVEPLSHPERVEMMNRAARYQRMPEVFAAEFHAESAALKERIDSAQTRLLQVEMQPEDYQELCQAAMALGVEGHRADIFAVRLARAHAALAERTRVEEEDLIAAIRFVLSPRAKDAHRAPSAAQLSDSAQNPEPTHEAAQTKANDQDLVLPSVDVAIPERLLAGRVDGAASHSGQGTKGKTRAANPMRGRYVRSVNRNTGKVALEATLRIAALSRPHHQRTNKRTLVRVTASDLRYKQFKLDPGLLVIFAVDASGSMALNRINHAKGAVIRLLQDAYQRRFSVAVVSFRGNGAGVLLPPTRSLVQAKRVLDEAAVGGGTPLASGIIASLNLARRGKANGGPPALLVLLTDGRANVASSGDSVWTELETVCRFVRDDQLPSVVIDTSNQRISSGGAERLAGLLGGTYVYLPRAGRGSVYEAVSNAVGMAGV